MREGRSRRLERRDFFPVAGRRDTDGGGDRGGGYRKERAGETEAKEGALRTVRYVERGGRTSVAFDMDRR